MDVKNIYHITDNDLWKQAKESEFYTHPSLELEGFIHCSLEEQIEATFEKYFKDKSGLLLLKIEVAKLASELIFEDTVGTGILFPHVYGPINLPSIISSGPFTLRCLI